MPLSLCDERNVEIKANIACSSKKTSAKRIGEDLERIQKDFKKDLKDSIINYGPETKAPLVKSRF